MVQDYQKLNQVTIKDKTPLPLIGEVIDKLKKAKYFNKLDLIWGYNNVWIKEGDKWKAAFLMNKGLFEPQVMYFELCNSPGIFQWMMNSIFWKLLHEGVLANYMDDFMILAKNMKELEERTIWFLKIAERHNLCFKQSKYNFNMEEIPILGVVMGNQQSQDSQGMENPYQDKGGWKFSRVCQLLQMVYKELITNELLTGCDTWT